MKEEKELLVKSTLLKYHREILKLEGEEKYETCQVILKQLNSYITENMTKYPKINMWNKMIRERIFQE